MNEMNFRNLENLQVPDELMDKLFAIPETADDQPAAIPWWRSRTAVVAASLVLVGALSLFLYFNFGVKSPVEVKPSHPATEIVWSTDEYGETIATKIVVVSDDGTRQDGSQPTESSSFFGRFFEHLFGAGDTAETASSSNGRNGRNDPSSEPSRSDRGRTDPTTKTTSSEGSVIDPTAQADPTEGGRIDPTTKTDPTEGSNTDPTTITSPSQRPDTPTQWQDTGEPTQPPEEAPTSRPWPTQAPLPSPTEEPPREPTENSTDPAVAPTQPEPKNYCYAYLPSSGLHGGQLYCWILDENGTVMGDANLRSSQHLAEIIAVYDNGYLLARYSPNEHGIKPSTGYHRYGFINDDLETLYEDYAYMIGN